MSLPQCGLGESSAAKDAKKSLDTKDTKDTKESIIRLLPEAC